MIWVAGRIVSDDALKLSALDRTFEHGLGLFETFRTWNGRPTLLDRHLARLRRSAETLRIPLDPDALPDASAVADLLRADGHTGDALLRITLTGGVTESEGSTLLMRSHPLPPPSDPGGVILGAPFQVAQDDPLARHKTLNYWRRRLAHQSARTRSADEALAVLPGGQVLEGSRTNLFAVLGGALVTPASTLPILPGIMRGVVLEFADLLRIRVAESTHLTIDILRDADEVFLTNSVRGLVPVARFFERRFDAPGPLTTRLWESIRPWLESGGNSP